MIREYNGETPRLEQGVYVASEALVIGRVSLGQHASVWPYAVIRGDVNTIEVGKLTNVQDHAVLHVTGISEAHPKGFSLRIGEGVTIGHAAVVHGCTIGNYCLIGMGCLIMDGATVENQVIVAAGSLVPPGKHLEEGFLYKGSPIKKCRPLRKDERAQLYSSSTRYAALKEQYLAR